MVDWSRRKLLAGVGSSVALATAGCASSEDEKPDEETEETPKDDGEPEETDTEQPDEDSEESEKQSGTFGSLLGYLPETEQTDVPNVYAADVTAMNRLNEPLDSFASEYSLSYLEPHTEKVSRAVGINQNGGASGSPLSVFEGEITPDTESESRETAAGEEYEYYELSGRVAAVNDGITIVADSDAIIEAAFGAKQGEASSYVEAREITDVVTDQFTGADLILASAPQDDFAGIFEGVSAEELSHFALGLTVHGPDTVESRFEIVFTDPALVTEKRIKRIEELATGIGRSMGEGTATVDGGRVTVRESIDLAKVRKAEEIESPDLDYPHDVDLSSEYLEIDIREGDDVPLDELTLQVNGETYDPGTWARDQESIGEGDTIYIATEDIEPNTQITLEHNHEYGTNASSTQILSHLRFEPSYDKNSQTATLTYRDDVKLDGDHINVAVYEGDRYGNGGEKLRSSQPVSGGTLENGDELTVENVDPGQSIIVGWKSDSWEDSLYNHTISPPGNATFEYDHSTDTLTVTLKLENAQDASNYELRVEDEPTDTQWSDEYSTVEDGDSLTVDGLSIQDQVTLMWTPTDSHVDTHWISPPGRVSFEYDPGSKEITATMELDSEQDAADYEILVNGDTAETQWTDQGDTVSGGDTVTLSGLSPGDRVRVSWKQSETPIGFHSVDPPGTVDFSFDQETNELEVGLSLEAPVDASNYTIRVDDEPASSQFTDLGETVEDGDSLTLEGVERGSTVSVTWGADEITVGRTEVYPTAELSFDYDEEADTITVTHEGGATFTAEKLVLRVYRSSAGLSEFQFTDLIDGSFTEGDTAEVEADSLPDGSFVGVFLEDEHLIGEWEVGEEGSN